MRKLYYPEFQPFLPPTFNLSHLPCREQEFQASFYARLTTMMNGQTPQFMSEYDDLPEWDERRDKAIFSNFCSSCLTSLSKTLSLKVSATPFGLKRGQILSSCHLIIIVRAILAIANTFSIYSEHPTSRTVIDLTQDDNNTDIGAGERYLTKHHEMSLLYRSLTIREMCCQDAHSCCIDGSLPPSEESPKNQKAEKAEKAAMQVSSA